MNLRSLVFGLRSLVFGLWSWFLLLVFGFWCLVLIFAQVINIQAINNGSRQPIDEKVMRPKSQSQRPKAKDPRPMPFILHP
jgi:hypothetical protein